MNNKIQKYRDEHEKNAGTIARLQERNKALDRKIMEEENLEIRAAMRSENITLAELMAYVRSMREPQRPVYQRDEPAEPKSQMTTEEEYDEDDE